jgi:hypothetical protein
MGDPDHDIVLSPILELAKRAHSAQGQFGVHLRREDVMTTETAEAMSKVELARNAPARWASVAGVAIVVILVAGILGLAFVPMDPWTKGVGFISIAIAVSVIGLPLMKAISKLATSGT